MSNLTAFAGDSLTVEIDLVDGITGLPVDASTISKAWVRIGAIAITTPTAQLTLINSLLRVTLTAKETASLRGGVSVTAKVLDSSGVVSTIANGSITFTPHNLSAIYE